MTDKEPASSIRHIENELKESEERFRLFFDQIPYILEIFTPDGMTVMVNKQWEETYQADRNQVIGKFNLLEDQQIKDLGILPMLQKAFNGEQVVMPYSEFDPAKSQYPGRKRWLRTKVIPIKDSVGDIKFVAIMHEDITDRKKAEDALRQSEEKYKRIFNSILDIYFETDIEGTILEISPSVEQYTGYKRDEALGKSVLEFYADPQVRTENILELIAHNTVFEFEIELIDKNNQLIPFSVMSILERDSQGAPIRISGSARCIADRKKIEQQLKQHVRKLEELEKIDQIIRSGTDADDVMGQVMETVLEIFNCDRAWLLYPCDPAAPSWQVPIERTKPEYPGALDKNIEMPMTEDAAAVMKKLLEINKPIHGILQPGEPNYDPNDKLGIRAYMITAVYPKVGKPWEFGLHQCSYERRWTDEERDLFQEISRRIEEALSSLLLFRNLLESEERYRKLVELSPDAILLHQDDRYVYANARAMNLLGAANPEKLIGKSIFDIIHPDYHAIAKDWIRDGLGGMERSAPLEEIYVKLDGEEIFVEVAGSPVTYQGKPATQVVVRDITDRMAMEQALRQAHDELEKRVEQRTLELEKANEQLATLYEMAQAIITPLRLNLVLDEIAHNTAKLFDTDTGVILLLDEEKGVLTIQGAYGLSEKVVKETRDQLGESIAGRVVQTGQPIIANDLPNDPRFYNPSTANEGLLACASVPLIARGKIIGTLDIHSKTDRYAFSQEHIEILSKLARQAAIAIENTRLYEQLQQTRDELEVRVQQRTAELINMNTQLQQEISERKQTEESLKKSQKDLEARTQSLHAVNSIANTLHRSLDLQTVVDLAVNSIMEYLKIPAVAIFVLDDETGSLNRLSYRGFGELGQEAIQAGEKLPLESSLTGHAVTRQELIISSDVANDDRLALQVRQTLIAQGFAQIISVPLLFQEQALGAMNLLFKDSPALAPHEWETLLSIAKTLGLAMANAGYVAQIEAEITARKQVEEELRKHRDHLEEMIRERTTELATINRELEAFSYSVSHDLRTPLRHISGYLNVLQESAADTLDTESQLFMTKISDAAQKMNSLIDGLLTLSRLGRQQLSKGQVDLNTLVQDVIHEHTPETHEREVRWQIADLPNVSGDSIMLQAAFSNLISNALKYTRPRQLARIEIGTLPLSKAEETIFIRDNGVGFDMAYADKLFGVFQRLHRPDEFEGTGIGLATVQRIIHRHEGRIWAEAEVDQGATFYFTLPRED